MNKIYAQILALTNAATLALLIWLWFFYCPANDKKTSTDTCVSTCYKDSVAAFTGLNTGLAKVLVGNYRKMQWDSYRGQQNNFYDARAVWFSLNKLKAFIHEIENSSCSSCMGPNSCLGVRFYYGTYPTKDQWTTYQLDGVLDTAYAGRHTVMLVPTYYDAEHKWDVDFDPKHYTTNPCMPWSMGRVLDSLGTFTALLPEMVKKIETGGDTAPPDAGSGSTPAAATSDPVDPTNSLANHGGLNPPPPDGRFDPGVTPATVANPVCEGTGVMYHVDGVYNCPACPQ